MTDVEDAGATRTRTPIQVIDRTVDLLTVIAGSGAGGIALKDLTAAVGLRPSTARTLLAALVSHGLVRQVEGSRKYLLGATFFSLTRSYVARADLSAIAGPVLQDLWERTQETVHLSILTHAQRVDIAVLVSPQLLNINPTTIRFDDGPPTPPYRTAAGRVLLAGHTPRERAELLDRFPWRPDPTPREEVEALLERVARDGWATNYEEDAPGVCGVAAPVHDHTGRVIAALCIGYPSVRHTPGHDAELRDAVVGAADELSALLGAGSQAVAS